MTRFRLLDEFESVQLWQAEHLRNRSDKMPAAYAWVQVRPGGGITVHAELLGLVVGANEGEGIIDSMIDAMQTRWSGLKRPRTPNPWE